MARPLIVAMCAVAVLGAGCTGSPSVVVRSPGARLSGTPGATAASPPPDVELAFDCDAPRVGPGVQIHAGDTMCLGTPGGPRHRVSSALMQRQPGAAVSPAWSPDGQRLLFRIASACLGDGCEARFGGQADDIAMVNADGSGFVNLTNHPGDPNWGADWSPDGTRIVFNSARGDAPNLQLWVMNADGSGLHRITRIWGEYPKWSPDGDLIAFMSNRCHCGSEYDVYTIHPDGTELKQLTSLPGEEGVGDWSPDGRWIAFGRDPDRYPGIYLIPRDGGPIRRLQPTAAGVHLRGVGDWEYGGFIIGALEGDDPQTSPQSDYWAPRTGRTATLLVKAASGAEWRPSGEGRSVATLTLKHRWLGTGPLRLEVTGTFTIGGEPGPHRKVILGRLGAQLPTERIRTVTTDRDGAFRVVLSVDPKLALGSKALRAQWRFATAFYGGSPTEWSTTAFDPLAD